MFLAQAARLEARTVFKSKHLGAYRDISWAQVRQLVEEVALALMDLGLQPGDRVALLSENRPQWAISDLGVLSAGGVTVPIYVTLSAEEIEFLLRNSGAKIIFVSNTELMAKILPLQKALDLKIILFDAPYRVAGPRIWWFGEMLGLGITASPEQRRQLAERIERQSAQDVASIIYTSGTTGDPKGVVLTHDNFLSNCRAVKEVLPMGEEDLLLSFLPLSHVFERMAGYYFVLSVGGTIAYAENLEAVPNNMLEVRPTVITGVPRFYEKIHGRILEAVRKSSGLKQTLFRWAMKTRRGSLQYRIANRLVFSKLRARLGGHIRFCVSGGAPLQKSLAEFFYQAGVVVLEGYGLTETSPVISFNRLDNIKFGTVGLPIPGVEVKLAEDGEILTRGPHIMKSYFNDPAATAEVIDAEGWLKTGDIGVIDADGFLTITDRKKDLIKTSGGKMVAPQKLEAALKKDRAIADCVVIGDKRKYLTALIVPAPGSMDQSSSYFWERVEWVNKTLAQFEQIKKITVLEEPFSLGSGELTPTLKVKRRVIAERYAGEIDAMYT